MGSKSSKGEVSTEAVAANASALKTNGQENGHMKTNRDVFTKPNGDAAATNGSAEAAGQPEAGAGGDAIQPAPPADTEAAGAKGETTAKKKKKFSLKKTFKVKMNLKKSKKSEAIKEEAAGAASPCEGKPTEPRATTEEDEKKKESKEEMEVVPTAKTPESAEQKPLKEEVSKEEAAPAAEALKPTEEPSSTPSEKKE
ncbi:MARCKS-related protein 1-B isoform X1 [Halichoeres trimaculatus]|uniref:MARCKS-related protein 1-B isoform X1 n=1 Tax=Halichoeres trimaculatus TaxID=147232 RepID=UPI003D9ED598